MENILLFILTVIAYNSIWSVWSVFTGFNQTGWKRHSKIIAVVALLALPLNIGGNVFTIAGNAVAEKSVYSLFSLYQSAGHDAMTFLGLAYQKAGHDAMTVLGLAYQKAGHDAMTFLGLAYQKAGHDAMTFLGLAIYQVADNKTNVPIAMSLYQRVGEKTRAFGVFSALTKD